MPSGGHKVKWLRKALKNLEAEAEYIARDDPKAAASVIEKIRDAVMNLEQHPALGRPGRVPDTRELIVSGTPYIVPYRVKGKRIEVLRVFHSARRWPTEF